MPVTGKSREHMTNFTFQFSNQYILARRRYDLLLQVSLRMTLDFSHNPGAPSSV
jgi:hypothetical protein